MTIDPTTYTSGHHLIQRLESHNPWWHFDQDFDPSGGVDAQRQAYHNAVEELNGDPQLLVIGGIPSTETEGLLEQLIGTVLKQEFQEQYIQDADLRSEASELIVPAENVLYLPLSTSALYQVQSTNGLDRVIDHFQTHVAKSDHQQYLFLENFHTLRRPSRRGSDTETNWIDALERVVEKTSDLTVVISVPSTTYLSDQLITHPAFDTSGDTCRFETATHLGFNEYLQLRYKRLDVAPPEQRFDPLTARQLFREAVRSGEVAPLVDHLQANTDDRVLAPSTLRRELSMYAVGGGRLTTKLAREGINLESDQFEQVLRNRGDQSLREHQVDLIEDIRDEITSVADQIYDLKDALGPNRLAAVIANDRPTEPVDFDEICTVLDIDRRTLREQYLRVLSELDLLGGVSEYANKRPRSIGLYHRDPSILAAFSEFNLRDVLRQEPGLASELWHTMVYDHTVRLSNAVNDTWDPKRGVVRHWSADGDVVDFVMKVDGRPVPVVFSPEHTLEELQRGTGIGAYDALESFLKRSANMSDEDVLMKRYNAEIPDAIIEQRKAIVDNGNYHGSKSGDNVVDGDVGFGIVVTNAKSATQNRVVVDKNGSLQIIQLPLWTYLRLA